MKLSKVTLLSLALPWIALIIGLTIAYYLLIVIAPFDMHLNIAALFIAAGLGVLANLAPIGTRSVLFGAHQFLIHPLFVAWAWAKLYGFPFDPRLWAAFFLHDIGYWGKPNMDGIEGESHPENGAVLMGLMFGMEWYNFCIFHSRFYAKALNSDVSRLCMADKLATGLEPAWLYLPRVFLSGEIIEYMAQAGKKGKYKDENTTEVDELVNSESPYLWHKGMTLYMRQWAWENRYLAYDSPVTNRYKAKRI